MISDVKGLFRQKCHAFLFLLISLLTCSTYSSAQIVLEDEYVELNTWPTFAISPDERFLVIDRGRGERGLKVLDFQTKKLLKEVLIEESNHVNRCLFTSDGKYLIIGDYGGLVSVLNPETFDLIRQWKASEEVILSLTYYKEDHLVTVSKDGYVQTWNVASGEVIFGPIYIAGKYWRMTYLPEQNEFATIVYGKKSVAYFLSENLQTSRSKIYSFRAMNLHYIPSSKELWTDNYMKGRLYQIDMNGEIISKIEYPVGGWSYDMARIGDKNRILTITSSGYILLFEDGEIVEEVFIKKKRGKYGLQLVQLQMLGNKRFAVSDESGTIRFYRLEE